MTPYAQVPAHVSDRIAKIGEMIGAARQRIAADLPVDLEPVNEHVRALCGEVNALPDHLGHRVRDDLLILSARLERLGGELKERLDEVKLAIADGRAN